MDSWCYRFPAHARHTTSRAGRRSFKAIAMSSKDAGWSSCGESESTAPPGKEAPLTSSADCARPVSTAGLAATISSWDTARRSIKDTADSQTQAIIV
jgi:hypothetical protein